MKKFELLAGVFVTLLLSSCERESPSIRDPYQDIPQEVAVDFNNRYPDVTVTKAYQEADYNNDGQKYEVSYIVFTDNEGLTNKAIYYSSGKWLLTEKKFKVDDFLFRMPRRVLGAYLSTGIEDEVFRDSNDYVIEISRNGLDGKQYEFHCVAPYSDGNEVIDRLVYHIVIADDGTLLSCTHGSFNRSVWCYDMRSSIEIVRSLYPHASILGAVNFLGLHELYIRDQGIFKTATVHDIGYGLEWERTTWAIDINTPLPESVAASQQAYEEKHPDDVLYALSYGESVDGPIYVFTYGSELVYKQFYVRVDKPFFRGMTE